ISPSTMSDYMNLRSNPSHGVIQKIADYFGVVKSDIDTTYKEDSNEGILSIYRELDNSRKNKVYNFAIKQLDEQNRVKENIIDMEDYKTIKLQSVLSAGTGIIDLEPEHIEELNYKGYIPVHELAFKVSGNSMEPLFEDGEIIFV